MALDIIARVSYTVNMNHERDYWTTAQLAEAAGVTTARIRQLLGAGTIRGEKLADRWLIRGDEARRWLAERNER